MQRLRLSLRGCHLGVQGARRERAHPAAAAGAAAAANELHVEEAVRTGVWVAAVHLKWESWTRTQPGSGVVRRQGGKAAGADGGGREGDRVGGSVGEMAGTQAALGAALAHPAHVSNH